jgi:hypothetical protein
MDKPEIIETNTCGYIKVDKLFINDVKDLKEEYLKIKESIINEILKENKINPNK